LTCSTKPKAGRLVADAWALAPGEAGARVYDAVMAEYHVYGMCGVRGLAGEGARGLVAEAVSFDGPGGADEPVVFTVVAVNAGDHASIIVYAVEAVEPCECRGDVLGETSVLGWAASLLSDRPYWLASYAAEALRAAAGAARIVRRGW